MFLWIITVILYLLSLGCAIVGVREKFDWFSDNDGSERVVQWSAAAATLIFGMYMYALFLAMKPNHLTYLPILFVTLFAYGLIGYGCGNIASDQTLRNALFNLILIATAGCATCLTAYALWPPQNFPTEERLVSSERIELAPSNGQLELGKDYLMPSLDQYYRLARGEGGRLLVLREELPTTATIRLMETPPKYRWADGKEFAVKERFESVRLYPDDNGEFSISEVTGTRTVWTLYLTEERFAEMITG